MRLIKKYSVLAPIIALVNVFSGSSLAAEDDYLNAIEAESVKVDSRGNASAEPDATAESVAVTRTETANAGIRDEFEKTLDEKYHGSFVFYKKLPERSQQEIVQEYERGTSFVTIRKKIIDRFMQR